MKRNKFLLKLAALIVAPLCVFNRKDILKKKEYTHTVISEEDYNKQRKIARDKFNRRYPLTPDECFRA